MKRVFLFVLDSFGIGEMKDAEAFGDSGANTLRSVSKSPYFCCPVLEKLGLGHIEGTEYLLQGKESDEVTAPMGMYGRMEERSMGKDTTVGHWEISGYVSKAPLPVYEHGFPQALVDRFCEAAGLPGVLCNLPYSGTKVLEDYGEEHLRTGKPILYTSADSVFQLAAHEELVPVEKLYEYCKIARGLLTGPNGVGRVIARPFVGRDKASFKRTSGRHDFSLEPPQATMLDLLKAKGLDVIGVGKIKDIFAHRGLTESIYTSGNEEGIEKSLQYLNQDFHGLCFINLVDYDMLYGHRRDVDGYAKALTYFDNHLETFLSSMREDDIIMITADHGCDPAFMRTTDHTREYTPILIYGRNLPSKSLGTRKTFADIAVTVLQLFGISAPFEGENMLK